MSKEIFLVPTDFSETAGKAVQYAAQLARINDGAIRLLHVLNPHAVSQMKAEGRTEADMETEMQTYSDNLQARYTVPIDYTLRKGSISHAIGEVAAELNSPVVVMGNHGPATLLQQIFGPAALRVVNGSSIPFLLVKKNAPLPSFMNIVLPIDHTPQIDEKLALALRVATAFGSHVHLFIQSENVASLTHAIQANVQKVIQRLDEAGIPYTLKEQSPEGPGMAPQILSYAQEVKAGLIIINSDAHTGNVKVAYGYSDERIINNAADIPVLCVHPVS